MCSIHSQSIQYPYYRIYLYRKRDTKIRGVESTEEKDTTAVGRMQKAEKKESGLLDDQRKRKKDERKEERRGWSLVSTTCVYLHLLPCRRIRGEKKEESKVKLGRDTFMLQPAGPIKSLLAPLLFEV